MNLHDKLIIKARAWLVKCKPNNIRIPTCTFVCCEIVSGQETADAIGFYAGGSILIECKTNHSDFLADSKKYSRGSNNNRGLGCFRYYLCPSNIIKPEEVPEQWGLLYFNGRGIDTIKVARLREINHYDETVLLKSVIRRLMGSKKYFATKACLK